MCEASAYLIKEGKEELLLESVDTLENQGDEISMVNIFGEQKRIKARIRTLSLVDHKIFLEPAEE
jgi:predicted RNA-binding protein